MTRLRSRIVWLAPVALTAAAGMVPAGETMVAQNNFPKPPGIERLDPALDQLVAPDAVIEVLAGGYDWTEGPVWIKNGGYLLFSDIPPNQIHRWKEGEGAKLYLTPSGYTGTEKRGGEVGSNGLTLDREGASCSPSTATAGSHGWMRRSRIPAEIHDAGRPLSEGTVQQPQRPGAQQRRHLLHRSRLWDGEAVGRSEA